MPSFWKRRLENNTSQSDKHPQATLSGRLLKENY